MPKKVSKDTITLSDIPQGRRAEEFLTDADMVGFLERSIEELPKDDPQRKELRDRLRQARVAEALLQE